MGKKTYEEFIGGKNVFTLDKQPDSHQPAINEVDDGNLALEILKEAKGLADLVELFDRDLSDLVDRFREEADQKLLHIMEQIYAAIGPQTPEEETPKTVSEIGEDMLRSISSH